MTRGSEGSHSWRGALGCVVVSVCGGHLRQYGEFKVVCAWEDGVEMDMPHVL